MLSTALCMTGQVSLNNFPHDFTSVDISGLQQLSAAEIFF